MKLVSHVLDAVDDEGFRVSADPARHPFCIGSGHPDDEAIRRRVTSLRTA